MLTNWHTAESEEYYWQQFNKLAKLADEKDHFESDEHRNRKKNVVFRTIWKKQTVTPNLFIINLLLKWSKILIKNNDKNMNVMMQISANQIT